MNKPTTPEPRPAGKPIPGPAARPAAAKGKAKTAAPKYQGLDIASSLMTMLGVIGLFFGGIGAVIDSDTRLAGLVILGVAVQLIVAGLMLRALCEIARNTANLNRLHQPKAHSNGT